MQLRQHTAIASSAIGYHFFSILDSGYSVIAAVLAVVFVIAGSAAHATDYSWKNNASGDWTDVGVWLPAGTPNSSVDNATIAVTGVPYIVTLDSNITVNTLTLNSSVATLNNTSNSFTFTTATLSAGTYTLSGGTMIGGTINEAGGTFKVQSGTLSNVSVTGNDLKVNGSLRIAGTLAIANHNLDLAASSATYFSGQSVDNLNITPTGTATIYAGSTGAATVTLGSGVTVHGGADFENYFSGDGVINNGIINADSPTNTSFVYVSKFTNNGTAEATGGGTLDIGNNTAWSNAGTLLASGGTINLSGNFTFTNTGTLNAAAGTISIVGGTFTNTSSTVTLTSSTGNLVLNGGTISGGTIAEAASGLGTLNVQSGTLSNVSVTGNDVKVNGTVHIAGTLGIANHNLDLSNNSALYFTGQSVDNLNITPAGIATIYAENSGAATVTLGSGVIVHGGADFENYFSGDGLINNGIINGDSTNTAYIYTSKFTNNGTAEASNGGTLDIGNNNTTWSNAGTLLASGGTINLSGNFTFTNTSVLNATIGTISIVGGTLTNTGSTVTLNSATGNLVLNGGSISGGTIAQAASGAGTLNVQSGTLSNVSVTGNDVKVNGSLHIAGTLGITNHNLDLANNSTLYFNGQAVDNLNITSASTATIYAENTGTATVTLGSGVTVHGGADFENYFGGDGVINNGLINGDSNFNTTYIYTSKFTNNGTAEASGGGTLDIGNNNTTWSNAGTLLASGGTIHLSGNFTNTGVLNAATGTISIVGGTLDNTGATLTLNSSTGNLGLSGGTISGGTIAQAASGLGTLNVQSGTLSNVSVTGNDVKVNGTLHVAGTLGIANHNLDLTNNSNLFFTGQAVDNLNITPAATATVYAESTGAATVTLGSGVTVHGGADFENYFGGDGLINNGLINGDSATSSSFVYVSKFTNNGTAEASGGGTLDVGNTNTTWTNAGTLLASGGTLNLSGNFTFTNTGTLNGSAGTISIVGGTLSNTSSIVTLNSSTGNLVLNGGTISGGTIAQAASGLGTLNVQSGTLSNVSVTGNDVKVNGTLHVAGTLGIANHNLDLASSSVLFFNGQAVDNLNITPASAATIYAGSAGAATVTLGPGVTVHGGADFENYFNGDGLINNGVINSDHSSNTYINVSNFTNNGTVEATNGSVLAFSDSTTVTNAGRIYLSNGTLTYTKTLNVGTGSLGGSGTINAPVALNTSSSLFAFNIGGTTKGTLYDSLSINGNLSLGGNLKLTLINGFVPTNSQTFTIVQMGNSNTISGVFANVANGATLPTFDGTGIFTVNYSGSQILLSNFQPVPEPASAALLGLAAAGLLCRRRRK